MLSRVELSLFNVQGMDYIGPKVLLTLLKENGALGKLFLEYFSH
jgi:hypothetical protein